MSSQPISAPSAPRPDEAIDLVNPSLPGHGFSSEPGEAGWNVGRIAGA